MHFLKNGHPAHVFTDADRRKAAAVTNQIRREMRELVELELLNRELERRVARIEAKRQWKREHARLRRECLHAQAAHESQPGLRDSSVCGSTATSSPEPRAELNAIKRRAIDASS
jgi:hypothetical protein